MIDPLENVGAECRALAAETKARAEIRKREIERKIERELSALADVLVKEANERGFAKVYLGHELPATATGQLKRLQAMVKERGHKTEAFPDGFKVLSELDVKHTKELICTSHAPWALKKLITEELRAAVGAGVWVRVIGTPMELQRITEHCYRMNRRTKDAQHGVIYETDRTKVKGNAMGLRYSYFVREPLLGGVDAAPAGDWIEDMQYSVARGDYGKTR